MKSAPPWMTAIAILFFACHPITALAQQEKEEGAKDGLRLNAPNGWRGERIALPPAFAPKMKFKGVEQVRFAPGMFDLTQNGDGGRTQVCGEDVRAARSAYSQFDLTHRGTGGRTPHRPPQQWERRGSRAADLRRGRRP